MQVVNQQANVVVLDVFEIKLNIVKLCSIAEDGILEIGVVGELTSPTSATITARQVLMPEEQNNPQPH